jgi:hypothetical protein
VLSCTSDHCLSRDAKIEAKPLAILEVANPFLPTLIKRKNTKQSIPFLSWRP